MIKVIAFGTFDILHPGHVSYLEKAKKLGDELVVVVSRDSSVRFFKKRDPIFGEKARMKMVSSLNEVDKVVLGNRIQKASDTYNILAKHRPDIVALGYDQKVDTAELKNWLREKRMPARIVRIKVSLNPKKYKSSKIREMLSI